jgi:hypothetical protein
MGKGPFIAGTRVEVLGNYWPCKIEENGHIYNSVEHYYQSHKTADPTEQCRIRQAQTGPQAYLLARDVTLREDWEEVKVDVMARGVFLKYAQNPELREFIRVPFQFMERIGIIDEWDERNQMILLAEAERYDLVDHEFDAERDLRERQAILQSMTLSSIREIVKRYFIVPKKEGKDTYERLLLQTHIPKDVLNEYLEKKEAAKAQRKRARLDDTAAAAETSSQVEFTEGQRVTWNEGGSMMLVPAFGVVRRVCPKNIKIEQVYTKTSLDMGTHGGVFYRETEPQWDVVPLREVKIKRESLQPFEENKTYQIVCYDS